MEQSVIKLLNDLLENISGIDEQLQGVGYKDFRNDRRLKIFIVENLHAVIDGMYNIPDDFKTQYTQLPWHEVEAIREKILKGFYEVNDEKVWKAVKTDLKKTRKMITLILG
jgi:uncharacterized protein with HEPN domain